MAMLVKFFEEEMIFGVKFEGFQQGKWISIMERYQGVVFSKAFERDEIT